MSTPKSWQATERDLEITFSRWEDVTDWKTNYPKGARLMGYGQSELDRTVHLTYVQNGKTVNLSMGKQERAIDNLRVLYLAVESMRLNELRGIAEVLESAYLQLASPVTKDPFEILGIRPDASLEIAEAVYRSMATKYHPDARPSGDAEKFKEITWAIDEIRGKLK